MPFPDEQLNLIVGPLEATRRTEGVEGSTMAENTSGYQFEARSLDGQFITALLELAPSEWR